MRLINADALCKYDGGCYGCPFDGCALPDKINRLPTVDAVPVVHGKWRAVEAGKETLYACSVCHTVATNMPNPATFRMYEYCPHCGAKMDRKMLMNNICPYNDGVRCEAQQGCESCGWYPAEHTRRVATFRDGPKPRNDMVYVPGGDGSLGKLYRRWRRGK